MSRKKHPGPQDRTPADLLASLADALNACERGDVPVRIRHGAAYSRYGIVMPPEKKDRSDGWQARVFGSFPMSPPGDGDSEN